MIYVKQENNDKINVYATHFSFNEIASGDALPTTSGGTQSCIHMSLYVDGKYCGRDIHTAAKS